MPSIQAPGSQWRVVLLGRVQHHVDHTINVSVRRRQCSDVDSESAGDGRSGGSHPAVVLYMDVWGMREDIRECARTSGNARRLQLSL